jgi:hypothetical protein
VVDRATTEDKKGINSWLVAAVGATIEDKKGEKDVVFLYFDEW